MSPLMIYIPQDAAYFKAGIDAVVTLLASSTFRTAIDIMLILSVSMVGYQYVLGK